MRRHLRAAAWTAAVLGICTAGALAGPSIAYEADPAPAVSYTEHAGSRLTAANLGLNDLDDPAAEAPIGDAPAPVAGHAVAPAVPETVLDEEPAPRAARSLADLVGDYSGSTTSEFGDGMPRSRRLLGIEGRAARRPARRC